MIAGERTVIDTGTFQNDMTSFRYADDVLTGKAVITKLVKRSERNGLVEVSVDVYNQNGELVIKDVTEAIVKCKTAKNDR